MDQQNTSKYWVTSLTGYFETFENVNENTISQYSFFFINKAIFTLDY